MTSRLRDLGSDQLNYEWIRDNLNPNFTMEQFLESKKREEEIRTKNEELKKQGFLFGVDGEFLD